MFPCICIIQCYNFCFIVKHDLANPRGERKPTVFLSYYCLPVYWIFSPDIPRFLPYSFFSIWRTSLGFPGSSVGKESAPSAGDPGSVLGWGRCPGEGNGNSLQYSCLENPIDRGAWRATIHGVARVGHDLVTKSPPLALMTNFLSLPSSKNVLISPEEYFYWTQDFMLIVLFLSSFFFF